MGEVDGSSRFVRDERVEGELRSVVEGQGLHEPLRSLGQAFGTGGVYRLRLPVGKLPCHESSGLSFHESKKTGSRSLYPHHRVPLEVPERFPTPDFFRAKFDAPAIQDLPGLPLRMPDVFPPFSSEIFPYPLGMVRIHVAVDGVFGELFTGLEPPPPAYLFRTPTLPDLSLHEEGETGSFLYPGMPEARPALPSGARLGKVFAIEPDDPFSIRTGVRDVPGFSSHVPEAGSVVGNPVRLQALVEGALVTPEFLGAFGNGISELQEEKELGKLRFFHGFPGFHGVVSLGIDLRILSDTGMEQAESWGVGSGGRM